MTGSGIIAAVNFLLSRINGDAPPRLDEIGGGVWMIREQA
jgi:hypothetical protein